MEREDAARRGADCANGTACADGVDETFLSEPTWIPPDSPPFATFSPPVAEQVLAELKRKMAALSGQLANRAAPARRGHQGHARDLDYLLEQFRILTFTLSGAMSRRILGDPGKIPIGLLPSLLDTFVDLGDRLQTELGRGQGRATCIQEVQRQTRTVSRTMTDVIQRLPDHAEQR